MKIFCRKNILSVFEGGPLWTLQTHVDFVFPQNVFSLIWFLNIHEKCIFYQFKKNSQIYAHNEKKKKLPQGLRKCKWAEQNFSKIIGRGLKWTYKFEVLSKQSSNIAPWNFILIYYFLCIQEFAFMQISCLGSLP